MNTKEVSSVQNLIENFLQSNKDKILFSHKKSYRTKAINSNDLQKKIIKDRGS